MADGAASVRLLCEIAAERGKLVDMHCDESDDPLSRHIETLADETHAPGPARPRDGIALHVDALDGQLLRQQAAAADRREPGEHRRQPAHQHHAARAPRHLPETPRNDPRAELVAAGRQRRLRYHDCVMDPWYSLGSGDMLEVAHMGLHVAQMTSQDAMRRCFAAVTTTRRR